MPSIRKSRRRSKRRSRSRSRSPTKEVWTIYTMKGCGYCNDAKKLLKARKEKKRGVRVNVIKGEGSPSVVRKMKAIGRENYDTWPKIFLNGKFIGGYSDLSKRIK